MTHRFQCQCGSVQGEVAEPQRAMRAVCYCRDCQTYAHLLGEPRRVLDALGGTDIVATQSRLVRFTAGKESLGCVSLSPRGLLRWYAKCCNTPIANTPRGWRMPYVGLVHTCLRQPEPLEQSFPKVQLQVNTVAAKGPPPPVNTAAGIAHFAGLMFRLGADLLRGSYKATPFFDVHGAPVTEVAVAPRPAVEEARRAVG